MITPSLQFVIPACLYLFSITSPLPWLHVWSLLLFISLLSDWEAFPTPSKFPKPPRELTGGSLSHLLHCLRGIFTELLGTAFRLQTPAFLSNQQRNPAETKNQVSVMVQIANEPRFLGTAQLCPSVVALPSEHCPAAVWKCIDLCFRAKEPIMVSQPAEFCVST